jgi:hypothetical protein
MDILMTITSNQLPAILAGHKKWLYREAGGQRADLQGADLRGAYLQGADLRGAYLRGADLRGAHLQGADLRGAHLQGADLRGADIQGAYLQGAYLQVADLRGADIQGADIQGADIQGAYLQVADLRGADIQGAYLRAAKWGSDEEVAAIASVQFTAHGECGRTLIAVRTDKAIHLRCGCFQGSPAELRAYIKAGNKKHAPTRSLALQTVLALVKAECAK